VAVPAGGEAGRLAAGCERRRAEAETNGEGHGWRPRLGDVVQVAGVDELGVDSPRADVLVSEAGLLEARSSEPVKKMRSPGSRLTSGSSHVAVVPGHRRPPGSVG
jgi:hypothetical protein